MIILVLSIILLFVNTLIRMISNIRNGMQNISMIFDIIKMNLYLFVALWNTSNTIG